MQIYSAYMHVHVVVHVVEVLLVSISSGQPLGCCVRALSPARATIFGRREAEAEAERERERERREYRLRLKCSVGAAARTPQHLP